MQALLAECSPEPCESSCILKPALAPCRLARQNVPEPCESRCTLKPALAPCRLCRRKEPRPLRKPKPFILVLTFGISYRKYSIHAFYAFIYRSYIGYRFRLDISYGNISFVLRTHRVCKPKPSLPRERT